MTTRCPHCHASNTSPSRMLRISALVLAWTLTMAMVFGGSVIGPFVIGILPVLFFGGISVIGLAHRYAYGDRICGACHRAYELDGRPVPRKFGPKPTVEHAPSLAA